MDVDACLSGVLFRSGIMLRWMESCLRSLTSGVCFWAGVEQLGVELCFSVDLFAYRHREIPCRFRWRELDGSYVHRDTIYSFVL